MSQQGLFPNTLTQPAYKNPITANDDFVGRDIFNKPKPIPPPMGKPQPKGVTSYNQRYKNDNPLGYWSFLPQ